MSNRNLVIALAVALGCAAFVALAAPDALAAPGGGVQRAGENAADLVAAWIVPVLFAVVGVSAVVALAQRSLGPALVAIAGGILAGFFLIDPKGAQSAFEGIYSAIF